MKSVLLERTNMSIARRFALACGAALVLGAASPTLRGGDEVFKGILADSQCALNVHSLTRSHSEMLQGKEVGKTEADCVWYCVKERGGRFVLQDKGKVYKLDKQDLVRELAGKKVKISGALDPKTDTIHVTSIEALANSN
jgi:hypothetical protein